MLLEIKSSVTILSTIVNGFESISIISEGKKLLVSSDRRLQSLSPFDEGLIKVEDCNTPVYHTHRDFRSFWHPAVLLLNL